MQHTDFSPLAGPFRRKRKSLIRRFWRWLCAPSP